MQRRDYIVTTFASRVRCYRPIVDEMAAALLALVAASWLPGPPGCPASPRRPSGVHAPQQSAFRMTSTPPREMDPRGFVVPQVGDVVKVPSKWPGEWDVAQVDFVQFVSSRQAYEVDLLPLKSVGQSMYRLPGRKPAAVRADVAKLSRLAATYVRASDAYQIDEAELQPLGGTRRSSVLKVPPWWRHSLLLDRLGARLQAWTAARALDSRLGRPVRSGGSWCCQACRCRLFTLQARKLQLRAVREGARLSTRPQR